MSKEIKLPTTAQELESLIDAVAAEGNFDDRTMVAAAVANQIMHLPQNAATCTTEFFITFVNRFKANHVAYQKLQELKLAEAKEGTSDEKTIQAAQE